MNTKNAFTLTEFLIVVTLAAIFIALAWNSGPTVTGNAGLTKQVNNVKQITLACLLFAQDHTGAFPNGHDDPELKMNGSRHRNPSDR